MSDDHHRFGLPRAMKGSLFVYALGALLAFVAQMFLARLMGPAEYGIYYYALTWLMVAALFSQFGLDQALLRFLPAYAQAGDWPRAGGILFFSGRLVGAGGLVFGALMALTAVALGERLDASQRDAFLLAALCLPLRGLIYVRQAALRSFMFTVRSLLPDAVIVPLAIVVLAAGMDWAAYASDAPAIMAVTLAALSLSFLAGAYWQSRLLPAELHSSGRMLETATWLRMGFMMLVINGAYMLLNNIDLMILGMFRSAEEVGIYGVSSRIASLVSFVLVAAYPAFAPVIARHQGARQELQRAIAQVMRPIAFAAVALAAILVVFGGFVLGLFGEGFARGQAVVNILVAGHIVNALCGPVALLLAYGGEESVVARLLTVTVIASAGLNLLLIPHFGMQGAACVTALSAAFWNLALYARVRLRLGMDASGWLPVGRHG